MSSMEVHLAGASEDKLLASLHFDQKASAQYVTARTEASFPSRVMRFALNDSGNGFLSGETLRLAMVIRNDSAAAMTPI